LITLGTFFPWVQLSGHVPVINFKILDLIDASNAYLFMYLIPVSGILIACFSVVSVFGGTRGWGPGWLWPTLTTVSTIIATIVVIVSVVWIDQDYISLGNEKYGSAAFIAAFRRAKVRGEMPQVQLPGRSGLEDLSHLRREALKVGSFNLRYRTDPRYL
jgi:hypothetical protein